MVAYGTASEAFKECIQRHYFCLEMWLSGSLAA